MISPGREDASYRFPSYLGSSESERKQNPIRFNFMEPVFFSNLGTNQANSNPSSRVPFPSRDCFSFCPNGQSYVGSAAQTTDSHNTPYAHNYRQSTPLIPQAPSFLFSSLLCYTVLCSAKSMRWEVRTVMGEPEGNNGDE